MADGQMAVITPLHGISNVGWFFFENELYSPQIMEQQNSQLNLVGQSIGRLKQMGTLIGEEVCL